MNKTASQIASYVLVKIAARVPGLSILNAVGKANKNPANKLLREGKIQALRGATPTVRDYELALRRAPKELGQFSPSPGPLFSQGTSPMGMPVKTPANPQAW